MDYDPISLPNSLSSIPEEVAARFVNFRTDTPTVSPPQHPPHSGVTASPPPRSRSDASSTAPATSPQPMPTMYQPAEPSVQTTTVSLAAMQLSPPAPAPRPDGEGSTLQPLEPMHQAPVWRSQASISGEQHVVADDDDSDGETIADCISSMIRHAQRSDRPERDSAWEEALPPLARKLLRLAFRPSSERHVVLAEAASLLAAGDDLFETDSLYGRSVLHWLCLLGDALIVKFVLERGGAHCVNDPDACGYVPLALVKQLRTMRQRRHTYTGASDVAEALIAHGARLGELSHKGRELMFLPDLTPALARILLGMGVDVDCADAGEGMGTPLVAACLRANWPLAHLLLDAGANVQARGRLGVSLLHYGAMPTSLALRLIDRGANPNARDAIGDVPLMAACETDNLALVQLLLQCGAVPEAVNDGGYSVLKAAESSSNPAILPLIREALMLQSAFKLASE